MKTTVASALHVRRVGLLITTASLVAIALATLIPNSGLPLTAHLCLICGSRGGVDAILNVLLFVPLGVGLALMGTRAAFALPGMAALSALIETMQFFLIPGRDATVGDLLTNTLGGAIGFAIAHHALKVLRPSPRSAFLLTAGWCAVWLAVQAISSFAFAPVVPKSQYYGQIARRLGNFELFRGRVLGASIGDMTVPDARLRDSPAMQRQILGGAPVKATVVASRLTPGIAPIVRVADAEQREIILLAQNGKDIVFGVRTGGTVLRLRPPFFSLPNVFAPEGRMSTGDTVGVSARYSAREARLGALSRSAAPEQRIAITPSLGWTLVLPFQWLIEGTSVERVLGWIWTAFLLIPLGYWATRMTNPWQMQSLAGRPALVILAVIAMLATGLVILPRAFGLAAAPLFDWLAAVTGVVTGFALATCTAQITGSKVG